MFQRQCYLLWLMFGLLLVGCQEDIQEQAETVAEQLQATAIAEAQRIAEQQAAQVQDQLEQGGARAEIIVRATRWATLRVPYGSFDDTPDNDLYEGYRADCSGFISYAWQLPQPGPVGTGFVSGGHAREIPIEELESGDALNNLRPGAEGHMVLFVAWSDDSHTQFRAFDLNTYPGYVSPKTFTLEQADDGWTIKELDAWADGPYYAQRLASLP